MSTIAIQILSRLDEMEDVTTPLAASGFLKRAGASNVFSDVLIEDVTGLTSALTAKAALAGAAFTGEISTDDDSIISRIGQNQNAASFPIIQWGSGRHRLWWDQINSVTKFTDAAGNLLNFETAIFTANGDGQFGGQLSAANLSGNNTGDQDLSDLVSRGELGTIAAYNYGDQAGEVPVLEAGGKLNPSMMPAIAISEFLGYKASQAAMLAAVGELGDFVVRTDTIPQSEWRIIDADTTQLSSWLQMSSSLVSSVNGQTGAVVLTTTNIAEGSNLYFLAAERTKLSGIAAGATANSTDAQLRDRSTHTGTQAFTTLTGNATVAQGGTAITTYTTGDILYASATNVLSKLGANATATAKYLKSVSSGAPAWTQPVSTDLSDTTDIPRLSTGNTFTGTPQYIFKTTVGTIWGAYSNGGASQYFQLQANSTTDVQFLMANKNVVNVNVNNHIFGDSSSTVHQFRGKVELLDAVDLAVNTTTGSKIGTATGQKIAFHNSTPVIQRAGSAQAAVATTAATNTLPYGYTQAQADGIIALLNEIRAALVEKGLIKGSA